MTSQTDLDRRRDVRIGAAIDLRFTSAADAAKALNACSINFSAGGLCIKTKSNRMVGEHLRIDVTIEGEHLELEAVVAWVRGTAVGVRFVNLEPSTRAKLVTIARQLEQRAAKN